MPYPIQTAYLTFGGALPGGEEWQCGLHGELNGNVASPTGMANIALNARTPLTTWWNSAGVAAFVGSGTTLTTIRAYLFPANATKATAVGGASLSLSGTGTSSLPNQCAIVLSLRTGDPSRRGRGRIYMPMNKTGVASNAQLTTGQVSALATATATLLQDLAAADSVGPVLGGTSANPVTSVVVDSVVDTQRRRRNQLTPLFTATANVVAP